jgi:predicted GIY-YIG superfamily endonuclease
MTLTLPADAEPFVDDDISDLRQPGVYALKCIKPNDMVAQWDRHFDHRPDYWNELVNAERVAYIGASNDVLARLEDHRDADVRKAALLEVCEPVGVLNIKFFPTAEQAFERESGLALRFAREHPEFYAHQR